MTPEPYVAVDGIRLYLMDCLEGMRALLPDGSVSVVVTSPPYNIGAKYGRYEDARPRKDYLHWIELVAQEVWRVLRPGGRLVLVGNCQAGQARRGTWVRGCPPHNDWVRDALLDLEG